MVVLVSVAVKGNLDHLLGAHRPSSLTSQFPGTAEYTFTHPDGEQRLLETTPRLESWTENERSMFLRLLALPQSVKQRQV